MHVRTRSHAGVFYAESWALTHMLAIDARYRQKWDVFLGKMQNGMPTADALTGAVAAALDNVRRHAGRHPRAWVLVESEAGTVTVTVRDDGPGIPSGRLAAAETEGRLGVSHSIRGRIAEVGGTVTIVSEPGQGTEVEIGVPSTIIRR